MQDYIRLDWPFNLVLLLVSMGALYSIELTDRCRKSNRLQIRNLPSSATKDDVQELVGTFGTIQRCDLGRSTSIIVSGFSTLKLLLRKMLYDSFCFLVKCNLWFYRMFCELQWATAWRHMWLSFMKQWNKLSSMSVCLSCMFVCPSCVSVCPSCVSLSLSLLCGQIFLARSKVLGFIQRCRWMTQTQLAWTFG